MGYVDLPLFDIPRVVVRSGVIGNICNVVSLDIHITLVHEPCSCMIEQHPLFFYLEVFVFANCMHRRCDKAKQKGKNRTVQIEEPLPPMVLDDD